MKRGGEGKGKGGERKGRGRKEVAKTSEYMEGCHQTHGESLA